MASTTQKDKFAAFQNQVLWIAIACFAASFLLDSNSAKESFGALWISVRQWNAVIMWLGAILSGKRFVDLFKRKAGEQISIPDHPDEQS